MSIMAWSVCLPTGERSRDLGHVLNVDLGKLGKERCFFSGQVRSSTKPTMRCTGSLGHSIVVWNCLPRALPCTKQRIWGMVGGLEKKSEVRQHFCCNITECGTLSLHRFVRISTRSGNCRGQSKPAELLEQISKVSGYEYKPELLALQMRAWEGRAEAKLAKSRLSPAKKW